ncbi:MAG: GNAT family N-acetyltransferase [Clostridia bacterium]|nr:GNAT family N-acetyltransferase [Clostridia bacterium]
MTAPNRAALTLRFATPADAEALVAIYAPYIQKTAITYEYEIPSTAEFAERIRTYSSKYPYLVAELDGTPVGYAYACPLGSRPAFDWSVETAIYIREDCKGLGIGKALYEKLEAILKAMGICTMTAAVASVDHEDPYLTNASIAFHLRMGFTPVGTFHNAGCKFGRWYDLTWLEKQIGAHEDEPPHPRTVHEVMDEALNILNG